MLLVLLRHGLAVDRADPACPADPDRPLTARGRRRTAAAVSGLSRLRLHVDAVLCSSMLRAIETAEIAAEGLGLPRAARRVTPALSPATNPSELLAEVRALAPRSVLCVGHAPHLDAVLAAAVAPGAESFTALKKAGVAVIALDAQRPEAPGTLQWVLTPRVLRRLATEG
jgi:phosphohistidine phosphatase